jgi:8-oxo-dGTP diphosphatase/2-hydroxy-dATP diphosphatase
MTETFTLCVVYTQDRILLGMKKRGFGAGYWNGFGGKLRDEESAEQAATRELQEEVRITPLRLIDRGSLTFQFANDNKFRCHLFSCQEFQGQPVETEEMRPQWFQWGEIPYQRMWPDDRYWLPQILAGRRVKGIFHFLTADTLLSYQLDVL